jgi:hypothetical protein
LDDKPGNKENEIIPHMTGDPYPSSRNLYRAIKNDTHRSPDDTKWVSLVNPFN